MPDKYIVLDSGMLATPKLGLCEGDKTAQTTTSIIRGSPGEFGILG